MSRAAAILGSGGLVAFPTETVYGLGADARNRDALARLYEVKGRPADHPVIVHLAGAEMMDAWAAEVPSVAATLAGALWPGPLTLVLRRAPDVADEVTGGQSTVGLRVPAHPVALALLRAFGGGVAAPSANRFGRVSPTTATAVCADLGTDLDMVLDGGACRVGVESTIVDCSGPEPRVLRVGGVTAERLAEILGLELPVGGATRAPGGLPAHYAPRARVELAPDAGAAWARAAACVAAGERAGVLAATRPDTRRVAGADMDEVAVLDAPADVDGYARFLYARLRDADALGLDVLVCVAPPAHGRGVAVRDRLERAATTSVRPIPRGPDPERFAH